MSDQDIETRRAADARHRENRGRLATAHARFETTGTGSTQFEDSVEFGLTFIERPFVSMGYTIDIDALAEALGIDEEDSEVPLPQVTSYVVEWDQDERGFFTGAWCAAVVAFAPDVVLPEGFLVAVNHHFTFAATAIKDVPVDVST